MDTPDDQPEIPEQHNDPSGSDEESVAVLRQRLVELQRTNLALRASEEKYAKAFLTSPDAININRLTDGVYLDINQGFTKLTGFTRDEVIGRSSLAGGIDVWVHPEDRQRLVEALQKHGEKLGLEAEFRRKNGETLIGLMSAKLIELDGEQCILSITRDITEYKRAARILQESEEALQESEETYREIFDMSGEAMMVHDSTTTEIYDVNGAFSKLYGYTHDEAIHLTIEQLSASHADNLLAIIRQHMQSAKIRETYTFEWCARKKDGSDFWAEVTLKSAKIRGKDRILTTVRDITERKRTEEALLLTKFSIDHAGDMIFWLDFDGHLLYVNDAGCRRLGYSKEEICHMTIFDIDPVLPREAWPQHSERLRQQRSFIIETRHRTKTGEIFPVEVLISYIEYNGKEYNFAFARDITERKRAEEAIKRESTFLASAIELLPFPIFIITPSYEVIRQNRASFALQRAPDTLPLGGVEFLDPQTHTPCPLQDWPIIHALRGKVMPTTEYILRQQDGREMSILLQTAPIFINEELVAAVVAIQDISALKDADRAKNQFLMVLSHEVKTPLTSIIGWAQLAQSAPDIVPEALGTILRNAHEQKILLERLLILSRILTGKLTLSCAPTDLWQVALHAVTRMRHSAEERHITVTLVPADDELRLEADGKLLEQAICEVLDNAVHFSPAGGMITMQGRLEPAAIVLVVNDAGQGIAPEQQSMLLTPFTQIQRKEEIGGLGIGLAVVRGIIEAHGGRVTISSAGPGQGTTVTFWFPRSFR